MIIVKGPIFLDPGLYKFVITPIAFGGELLPDDQKIPFEALITFAEIRDHEIEYNGEVYTIEMISYYDSIKNVEFDPDSLALKVDMPFDWDMVDEINMLHFEISLPEGFVLVDREMSGYINGIEQQIFVDRAAEDWGAIVHFMISQKRLKELAPMMSDDDLKRAVIEVRGGAVIEELPEEEIELPEEWSPVMSVKSSRGSVLVEIQWSPVEIDIEQDAFFKLTFKDPETGEVLDNVRYDIMFMDEEGNMIAETHRSAQSKDIQIYRFDKAGTYTLMLKNINDTGEDAMVSIKVVPEFPIAILLVMSIAMIIIVATRFRSVN